MAKIQPYKIIIIVAFFVLFIGGDVMSGGASPSGEFSPWYIGAALDVLLLVSLGWRWWPLVPLAEMLRFAIFGYNMPGLYLNAAVLETGIAITYVLALRFARKQFGMMLPLTNTRDAIVFLTVVAFAAPLLAALVAVSIGSIFGFIHAPNLLEQVVRVFARDASAIVVVVPTITTFVDLKFRFLSWDFGKGRNRGVLLNLALIVITIVGGFAIAHRFGLDPILDITFVPLAILAMREGMRGALIGVFCAYIIASALYLGFDPAPAALIHFQAFLLAAATMVILLGALTGDRQQLLDQMQSRTLVDELTLLPNRESLIAWLEERRERTIVLLILDVDDMRMLNEGVGRVAADGVLRDMAFRLRTLLPFSYYVARVSADEFAVALIDDRSPHAIMNEIRALFELPFEVEDSRFYVSVSLGAVRMARAGSADELLRKADLALNRAKFSPSRGTVYSPDLQAGPAPSLVGELHRAVERNEFVPFFQPIFKYDARSNTWKIAGAEALLRWQHPERGVVSPVDFIDLLERLTISERVGWMVVDSSIKQAMQWRKFVPDFRIWVNLFARQALDHQCANRIAEAIERHDAPPDALCVEISEKIVASDERDIGALVQALSRKGIKTAIDDFGTGGSSLGRVRDVSVDMLKIDRSFVNRSEIDAKARAVATTVVRLGAELGMNVLAEGVENAMQADVMLEIGCHYAQGYALGHPMPADLFARTTLDMYGLGATPI